MAQAERVPTEVWTRQFQRAVGDNGPYQAVSDQSLRMWSGDSSTEGRNSGWRIWPPRTAAWRVSPAARSKVRLAIEDVLESLPKAFGKDLYQQKCKSLFEHVYEAYPQVQASS